MKQLTVREYYYRLKAIYKVRKHEARYKKMTLMKDFIRRNKYSLTIYLKWKKGIIESWFSYRKFQNKMLKIALKQFWNVQKLFIPYNRNFYF